jgi:hypothetical protein
VANSEASTRARLARLKRGAGNALVPLGADLLAALVLPEAFIGESCSRGAPAGPYSVSRATGHEWKTTLLTNIFDPQRRRPASLGRRQRIRRSGADLTGGDVHGEDLTLALPSLSDKTIIAHRQAYTRPELRRHG